MSDELKWGTAAEPELPGGAGDQVTHGPPEKKTARQHAERMGVSVRGVKNWLALGREKGDPCPLEDPAELLAWFGRHLTRAPNSKLVARLVELGAKGAEVTEVKKISEKKTGGLGEAPAENEMGFRAALQAARIGEFRARKDLESERNLPDGEKDLGNIFTLQKIYDTALESLRKFEKDAPKHLGEAAGIYSWPEIETRLTEVHSVIAPGVRGLFERIESKDYVRCLLTERRQIFMQAVEELFGQFAESKFGLRLAGQTAA